MSEIPSETPVSAAIEPTKVADQAPAKLTILHVNVVSTQRNEDEEYGSSHPPTPGSAVPLQIGRSSPTVPTDARSSSSGAGSAKEKTSCRSVCDLWFIRLAPFIFVLIWSTGFIAARFGRSYTPPATFLLARFGFSMPVYLLWAGLGRAKWPVGWKQYGHLAVTGILMNFFFLGGVWAAVRLGMGAGLSALITGLQPVLTAIWVAARGGRITWSQWLGLVLGVGGLVLVVWQKLGAGEVTVVNALFCCTSLVCITAGTLYQKAFLVPSDVRTANFIQMLASFIVCLPVALAIDIVPGIHMQWIMDDGSPNWTLIGALAWSVLGLSLGGGSLLFVMLQRGAATRVSALMFLAPAVTALIAWPVFGEQLTWLVAGGIVITIVGVGLVVRAPAATTAPRSRESPPETPAAGLKELRRPESGSEAASPAASDAASSASASATDIVSPIGRDVDSGVDDSIPLPSPAPTTTTALPSTTATSASVASPSAI